MQGRIATVNPACSELFGWNAKELVGRGIDLSLSAAAQWVPEGTPPPQRDAVVAALNGLHGDHLQRSGNPLAIAMTLRHGGQPLDPLHPGATVPAPTPRLLVLVHGLCMSDGQWLREGHDHGAMLAALLVGVAQRVCARQAEDAFDAREYVCGRCIMARSAKQQALALAASGGRQALLRAAEADEPAVLESIAPGELGASLVATPIAHALCFRLGGVQHPTWLYLDRAEPFRDRDGSVLAYVEAAARIAALALAHREGISAAAERERLMAERAQARRVQQQLCASRQGVVGALDYAFSTEPGDGMCGDFIDVIDTGDGAVWCFVGDVVGHGTAAALLMATALAIPSLRARAPRSASS